MASPFQQAAAQTYGPIPFTPGPAPYGFGALPRPYTYGELLKSAYGITVPQGSFFAYASPEQMQLANQALGYYERANPQYARETYFQDPGNVASFVQRQYNDWLSEFQNRYFTEPGFKQEMEAAGIMNPHIPFHEWLELSGYDPTVKQIFAPLYGGQLPESTVADQIVTWLTQKQRDELEKQQNRGLNWLPF